jgi:Tfp pilus assembly protein PilF
LEDNRMTEPPEPEPALPNRPEDRLDSWKEIAVYLNRDVKTVQRWERWEGLPVRRHHHKRLATVYAYRSELDEWLRERQPERPQNGEAGPVPRVRRRFWRLPVFLGLPVATALLLVGSWSNHRFDREAPAIDFRERDWVLIARFDNRTGEEAFDDVVEHALAREIGDSRFVNVVGRERINDALTLMRRPTDTPVDLAVGREICLRDGGIRALVGGRVDKLGPDYVFTALLIKPDSGEVVGEATSDARGMDQVWPAIRRLGDSIRAALGESLPALEAPSAKMERVTTPSLMALRLYSRGMALVNDQNFGDAIPLLAEAVAVDPEFASAHVLLAHCHANLGDWPLADLHFRKAKELSDATTDRERFFILASYYGRSLQDRQKARDAYRVLVDLHPDHFWGVNNLALTLIHLGQVREAVEYLRRSADLRPRYHMLNLRAARYLLESPDGADTARPYLDRARELLDPPAPVGPMDRHWMQSSLLWLEYYAFHEKWLEGAVEESLEGLDRLFTQVPAMRYRDQRMLYEMAGCSHLALGRLGESRRIFENMVDVDYPGWLWSRPRDVFFALAAYVAEDGEALRHSLDRCLHGPDYFQFLTPIFLARSGRPEEAEAFLEEVRPISLRNDIVLDPVAPVLVPILAKGARTEIALARGRTAESVPVLRETLETLRELHRIGIPEYFLFAEALATALAETGNPESAYHVLIESDTQRHQAHFASNALWLRNKHHLARICRRLGRVEEARVHEAELRRLLALADADHPILRALDAEAR